MFNSCICVTPDEVDTLLSRRRHKARQPHKCGECGCVIERGETYEADVTIWEDVFTVHKTCRLCLRIRESLFDCGWYYGQIWADIHQALCGDEEGECVCPR